MQVGVIKLSGFNARAQQDVAQAVKQLTQQGASEFTLDVRDNRGGLYQEGAEVAKLFLEGKAGWSALDVMCSGSGNSSLLGYVLHVLLLQYIVHDKSTHMIPMVERVQTTGVQHRTCQQGQTYR